jgi:CBS domain-containing protein
VLGFGFLWMAQAIAGPIDFDADQAAAKLASLGPTASLLLWLGPVNIVLALFNLVPGFPLDGGRVLRAVMWGITGNLLLATRWASRAGQGFAWLLMAAGFVMVLGYRVPLFGSGVVNGIWLAFIGWLLNNAALVSYRQLLVRESLDDVPVHRLMQTRFTRIDPDLTVSSLVDQHLMASGQRAFPVVDRGRFVGLVTLSDIQKCERQEWPRTPVSRIMTPAGELLTAEPTQDAADLLALIGQRDLDQIPVVAGGELLGLLRRKDILHWLSLHAGLPRVPSERP